MSNGTLAISSFLLMAGYGFGLGFGFGAFLYMNRKSPGFIHRLHLGFVKKLESTKYKLKIGMRKIEDEVDSVYGQIVGGQSLTANNVDDNLAYLEQRVEKLKREVERIASETESVRKLSEAFRRRDKRTRLSKINKWLI